MKKIAAIFDLKSQIGDVISDIHVDDIDLATYKGKIELNNFDFFAFKSKNLF